MKKAFLLAAGVAVLASPALSQSSSRDDDRDSYSSRSERGDRGWRGSREGRWHEMRDYGGKGGGARFMLRSGEATVAVRCDESESMRACVDATLMLLDRVRPQGATPSASGSGSGAGTSGTGTGAGSPNPSR